MHDVLSLLSLLLCAGPGAPAAGPDPRPPAEACVTVTADLMPQEEARSSRLVKVVPAEELERLGVPSVLEALRRIGGLAYTSYGPGGVTQGGMNSSLSIRGMKGGELVLINGLPIQGISGGAYDLNALKIGQVERIEVLKGAASTLYGSNAMSGVINIVLRRSPARGGALAVEGGTRGHREALASLGCARIQASFGYTRDGAQDEISLNETKKNRFDRSPVVTRTWSLGARLAEGLYADLLGSSQRVSFEQVGLNGKLQKGTDQDQVKHFADLRYEAGPWSLSAYSSLDLLGREEYTAKKPARVLNRCQNEGLRAVVDLGRVLGLGAGELRMGGDWNHRWADYPDQYGRHAQQDMALFAQGRRDIGELGVTAGLRGQFIRGEDGVEDHRKLLPSLGLSWRAAANLSLFANASQAFRMPTFNQLYYRSSFLEGNPELKPEQGWTYEVGLKQDTARTRTRLGLFRMAYTDKIEIDRRNGPVGTYYNAGSYRSEGLEWDLGVAPLAGADLWITFAGYWASPSALDAAGVRTQTGPKVQASLGLRGNLARLEWDLGATTLAQRERGLTSATLVHAKASYPLGPGRLSLHLDNLFDRRVALVGDQSPETTNRYAYYDQGFSARAGYALRF